MKKRTASILIAAACTASMLVGVTAAEVIKEIKAQLRPDFTVVIDGEEKTFKNADGDVVHPVLYDGTTYLPIRAIGEIMGKTVYWYENEKRIELKEETLTVTDADVIITDPQPTLTPNKKTDKKQDADYKDNKKADKVAETIDKSQFIGEDKAKEIALKKAGFNTKDTGFTAVKLDHDDGVWQYEVKFRKDAVEYEVDIKATDGTILSYDADID